jgi:hypothetical protein
MVIAAASTGRVKSSGHQHRPDQQRYFMRHPRCAHVEECGDEVDRTKDRRGSRQVKRENCHVDGRADRTQGANWCMDGPGSGNKAQAQ